MCWYLYDYAVFIKYYFIINLYNMFWGNYIVSIYFIS